MCMGEAGEKISDPPTPPVFQFFLGPPAPPILISAWTPPTLISTCYMGNKWTSYYVNLIDVGGENH